MSSRPSGSLAGALTSTVSDAVTGTITGPLVSTISGPVASAVSGTFASAVSSPLAGAVTDTVGLLARALGRPAALRGLAVEGAWCAAWAASYPLELVRPPEPRPYRTGALSPGRRGRVVSDITAEGMPVLLVHGLRDSPAVLPLFRRELRARGFGLVEQAHFDVLTQDVRAAALELDRRVRDLRDRTGADRVHLIGHSVGGLVARYYVQRLDGDAFVHTVATVATPHGGTRTACFAPTAQLRQLAPGSPLLTELAQPAPGCRTRFLVVSSDLDQVVLPTGNADLAHADLRVRHLRLADVGHLSLAVDRRTAHWVATSLPLLTG